MKRESQLSIESPVYLMGFDEVGRGPLAGPVVAAGVGCEISKKNYKNWCQLFNELGINDSKQISAQKRRAILTKLGIIKKEDLTPLLTFDKAQKLIFPFGTLHWCLCEIKAEVIDEINILQASLLAMRKCAGQMAKKEKSEKKVWIDGNQLIPELPQSWEQEAIIKGDQNSWMIGLASIVAKEARDAVMKKYHEELPLYGFDRHAGYPTKQHREAIREVGISAIHRKTFKGVREHLSS